MGKSTKDAMSATKNENATTKTGSVDLMQLALAATKDNVTTRKSKKSINDNLFEMLYEQKRAMARTEIINEISFERLAGEVGEVTEEKLAKAIEDGTWESINKTVKNGLDTAVCNGKTSASFCSNKRYEDYELINEANKFSIIKKEQADKK